MEFLPTSKSLTNDFSSETDNESDCELVIDEPEVTGSPAARRLAVETPKEKKKRIEKKKIEVTGRPAARRLAVETPDDIATISRDFREFLNTPSFMKGDVMIGDVASNKSYNIPDISIPKFFNLMEKFRIHQVKQLFYEKQGKYSGIMLDFDIKITHGGKSDINDTHYERLSSAVLNILRRFIQFPKDDKTVIHIGFTKKTENNVLY